MLREKHAALAEKLGLGVGTIDTTHEAMLSEALRDLSLAIAQYGIVLAGSIKPHDPASEQRVLIADHFTAESAERREFVSSLRSPRSLRLKFCPSWPRCS